MKHRGTKQARPQRSWVKVGVAVVTAAAIAVGVILYNRSSDSTGPLPDHLPTSADSYLGVYTPSAPGTYAGVQTIREPHRGKAGCGHVLQRMVRALPCRIREDGGQ